MTLGDALRLGQNRNLDLLRLVLAAAVIISHAWPLALGPGTAEPMQVLTGRSLGGWAVGIFFFLSGFLITASASRHDGPRFWAARARRIGPGLVVALMATLALSYAGGATAGSWEAFSWFGRAVTLVSIEHRLSGAFASNPYPEVVNGPLWSLFHEVAAYCLCALFVWSGAARNRRLVIALLALAVIAGLISDVLSGRLATFAPLFAGFTFGMATYLWRDTIPCQFAIALVAIPPAILAPWPLAIGIVGFGVVILCLALPTMPIKSDASFGLYIYGWPVAQTLVASMPGIQPLSLALLSVAATYPLALFSWTFVERPALVAHRATV